MWRSSGVSPEGKYTAERPIPGFTRLNGADPRSPYFDSAAPSICTVMSPFTCTVWVNCFSGDCAGGA